MRGRTEGSGVQVDRDAAVAGREIEGIVAAAVPDADRRVGAGEAVDVAATIVGIVGAVQILDRLDVVEHRRHGIEPDDLEDDVPLDGTA